MTSVVRNFALSKYKLPLRSLLLICSFVTLSASILIAWTYLSRVADGRPPSDGISPLHWEIPNAAIWILLFPFIYYVVRRNALRPNTRIPVFVTTHVFFAFFFAAIHLVINILFSSMLFELSGMLFKDTNPWCPWISSLRMSWRILFYCLTISVCYAVDFFDLTRIEKNRNASLQTRLEATRLKQMKIRIDPVFVQRTLSSVALVMHTNTRKAVNTIARLGAFFRLIQMQDEEISIAQHAKLLRSYFRVETQRTERKIRAIIRIDRGLAKARIPDLQLQSLVHAFYSFRAGDGSAAYSLRILLRKKGRRRIRLV
jgi:hypothetical protein